VGTSHRSGPTRRGINAGPSVGSLLRRVSLTGESVILSGITPRPLLMDNAKIWTMILDKSWIRGSHAPIGCFFASVVLIVMTTVTADSPDEHCGHDPTLLLRSKTLLTLIITISKHLLSRASPKSPLSTRNYFFGRAGVRRLLPASVGRRIARTLPVFPPPQKNCSRPSDSSPETLTPGGISSLSRTSPV